MRLLTPAYAAANAANRVIVITAGLSPTGVTDGHSADDVEYLQWLFDAGLKGGITTTCSARTATPRRPKSTSAFGSLPDFPHPSFYFRRIEQLRDVQVKNGDADKPDLAARVRLDRGHDPPQLRLVRGQRGQEGQQHHHRRSSTRAQHWSPWIGVMTLWTLPDPDLDDRARGVLVGDRQPRRHAAGRLQATQRSALERRAALSLK